MDEKVKELLDRIRGTASVAVDACADTARVAGKRAGQMVDIAKVNVQLFDLNGEFQDTLRQLGQVMYNTHLGIAQESDAVSALLRMADEQAEKVAQTKARIADLRQAKACAVCANSCARDDLFCRRCGAPLGEGV